MKENTKKRALTLLLCYLLAMVVWGVVCGARLVRDSVWLQNGLLEEKVLTPDDLAAPSGVIFAESDLAAYRMLTTDADPQFVYETGGRFVASRLVLDAAAHNRPSGELVVYYTTKLDENGVAEPFSEAKKVWATQDAAGRWVFDLGGRAVYSLRIDVGSVGGVIWEVEELVLNEPIPVVQYFIPDALEGFLLLLGPVFAWAVLQELIAFLRPVFARRRFEARWKEA